MIRTLHSPLTPVTAVLILQPGLEASMVGWDVRAERRNA